MFQFSAKTKKYLTLIAKAVGVFLLLAIVVFFTFRTYFLEKAIGQFQQKLKDNLTPNYTLVQPNLRAYLAFI